MTDEELAVPSVLFASEHRLSILRHLRSDPASVAEVSAALDVPQPTVKHNLSRLVEEGLVGTTGSTYEITTLGSYVHAQTTEYLRRIAVSRTLTPFLRVVEPSAADFDLLLFEDARVTTVDPTNPHAPIERLAELAADTEYLRVVTPILPQLLHDVFHEGLVDRELHLDLVVTDDLFERLRSRFGETYGDDVAGDRLVVGIYPDDVPFGLFLFEDALALLGHDEQNIPRCLVETDSVDATRWANDLFRTFEQDADAYVFGADDEFEA